MAPTALPSSGADGGGGGGGGGGGVWVVMVVGVGGQGLEVGQNIRSLQSRRVLSVHLIIEIAPGKLS